MFFNVRVVPEGNGTAFDLSVLDFMLSKFSSPPLSGNYLVLGIGQWKRMDKLGVVRKKLKSAFGTEISRIVFDIEDNTYIPLDLVKKIQCLHELCCHHILHHNILEIHVVTNQRKRNEIDYRGRF